MKGKPLNIRCGFHMIVGDCFISKVNGAGDNVTLSKANIAAYQDKLTHGGF